MELSVLERPGKEWDEFAFRYTDLIFYQSVWSEVLRKGLGGHPLYFCLKEKDDIVAGLPGVLFNFKLFKIFYASIPFGNLVGERGYFPALMELAEKEFERRGVDQVRISDSPFSEPYFPPSYRSLPAKVSLLDLRGTDKEGIWNNHKKYIRRDVRKAEKSGVTIRPGSSAEDVRLFYDLYVASMKRNRAAAKYPLQWFRVLCEGGPGESLGTIRFAVLDQTTIAGLVLIHSASTTHYLHNGSRGEFLKYCPNELLVHSSIEEALDRRSSFFDFMGSDPSDASLLKFKEKWGSHSRDSYTYIKDFHPLRSKIWELGKSMGNSQVGSWLMKLIRQGEG